MFALAVAFLASGALHELLVNLPLWLLYGTNLLGSMFAYFLLLQLGAIIIERRFLRRFPLANRLWLWVSVVAPAPLVLNQATLRAFQLAG